MRVLLRITLIVFFILASCKDKKVEKTTLEEGYTAVTPTKEEATISCGAFCNPPTITATLPSNPCNLSEQKVLNCFAWENFIALNWKASPSERGVADGKVTASSYGTPGDYSNTVWESYLNLEDIFTAHGPEPWDTAGKLYAAKTPVKTMKRINKVGSTAHNFDKSILSASDAHLSELFQAQGTWLTDQAGNLVWYEVKINKMEYDFIKKHQLYDPSKQTSYAAAHNGIWNPTGSIETKAAWRIIPEKHLDSLQKMYKVSKAMIPEVTGFDAHGNPILGAYTEHYLGLVGLHIIHKTSQAPQFIWMTFEHVNNAPTAGDVKAGIAYNFYNKSSTATPNQSPDPKTDQITTPVQVERIANNALTTAITTLNGKMQELITAANQKSVFQYYELVNVQWPENPIVDSSNNTTTPLKTGGITPNNIANTTMETYAQPTQCMSCHKYGHTVDNSSTPTDYSFVYLKALKQVVKKKRK